MVLVLEVPRLAFVDGLLLFDVCVVGIIEAFLFHRFKGRFVVGRLLGFVGSPIDDDVEVHLAALAHPGDSRSQDAGSPTAYTFEHATVSGYQRC